MQFFGGGGRLEVKVKGLILANKKKPQEDTGGKSQTMAAAGKHACLDDSAQEGQATVSGRHGFPIVAFGASAGGLAAFEAFFTNMPLDNVPGIAFILVQHLAPDHKSLLPELIRRHTCMQVFDIEDGMPVHPNCIYIIPPNRDIALLNGALQLLEPSAPRGQRMPIDFFFRSLAQDQHEHAVAIVLSGSGCDGTLGVRAIKSEAGMVMVQQPETAEFDGMPRSAIATDLVDFVLPPEQMPAELLAYVARAQRLPSKVAKADVPLDQDALKKIFVLLRNQVGHDFSQYKPSTVLRRIERRKAVHQIESSADYVHYLQQNPAEVEALFRDLLIGVTNFFRDPEAFQVLEESILPKLVASKASGEAIRIWTAGCSTGEEAYSLAILLQEQREALKHNGPVQIFATDIDSRAITIARAGIYPASIATDLTEERLTRFFFQDEDGSYRIHKGIRDLLIFSEQDLIKDPPFSRLDLISCRNLMIYLGAELQKKLIPLFHYALRPGGILFLGTSEGIGEFDDLFAVLDRKSKLYQRKEDFHGVQRAVLGRFLSTMSSDTSAPNAPRASGKPPFPVKLPLRELTEKTLLQQFPAVGVLVNRQGDVLYLHGRSGLYLEPAQGEAGINNILKMARDGLRASLVSGLHQAATSKDMVRIAGLKVKTNDHYTPVNLAIIPLRGEPAISLEAPLYLVMLEQALPAPESGDSVGQAAPLISPVEADAEARIAALRQELRAKEEYLQSAIEELESSTEELKSSNEEMQSVNEELQSTNEELETSKEELQSVNEELATINAELQSKVLELSRANNDMNNLLAGTGIGTVFVDLNLRILRFTPAASQIINLIPSDVGRPMGHIVSNLVGYDHLVVDVKNVLDTLTPFEKDVQTVEGRWFKMRILPYRTLENVIEGAVITYIDINEHETLRLNEERYRLAAKAARDVLWDWDIIKNEQRWNEAGIPTFGWSDIVSAPQSTAWWVERIHPEDRQRVTAAINAVVEDPAQTHWDDEYRFRKADGDYAVVLDRGFVLRNEQGLAVRMIGTMLNITARKQSEDALRLNEERMRVALKAFPVVIFNQDIGLRYTWIYNPKPGFDANQVLGKTDLDLLPADQAHKLMQIKSSVVTTGLGTRQRVNMCFKESPGVYDLTIEPLRDSSGAIVGITCALMQLEQEVVEPTPE